MAEAEQSQLKYTKRTLQETERLFALILEYGAESILSKEINVGASDPKQIICQLDYEMHKCKSYF